ncbi:hypothetical protein B0J12DRAFT_704719 [Macrophomina phaseolina]|uniref:Uncharacterized protein n=1 Tax=Macrophomina phaseolina TaxID=35725 RepID=A0ABQ8FUA1_9PEZI|nr:hypothetical protein B0J12DRAFT_704719 [Macrophomina phaseolina]
MHSLIGLAVVAGIFMRGSSAAPTPTRPLDDRDLIGGLLNPVESLVDGVATGVNGDVTAAAAVFNDILHDIAATAPTNSPADIDGAKGGESFGSNFIPLLTGVDYADPVWLNIPGFMLDDAQVNSDALVNDGPGQTSRIDTDGLCQQLATDGLSLTDVVSTEGIIPVAGAAILAYPIKLHAEPPLKAYATY